MYLSINTILYTDQSPCSAQRRFVLQRNSTHKHVQLVHHVCCRCPVRPSHPRDPQVWIQTSRREQTTLSMNRSLLSSERSRRWFVSFFLSHTCRVHFLSAWAAAAAAFVLSRSECFTRTADLLRSSSFPLQLECSSCRRISDL